MRLRQQRNKSVNAYIYNYHDKLRLKKRSDDPHIPENAFKLTIDSNEFEKYRLMAGKDKSFDAMDQALILNKQRWLLTRHMG